MTEQEYAETARQFHETLDALQFGQSLDEARFLVASEEPLAPAGLVSRRMLYMQMAYILQRTLVFRPSPTEGHTEYYEPLGRFALVDIEGFPAPIASFDVEQRDKVVRFDFPSFWANSRLRRFFYTWAPPGFASLKCGRLIFDGETLTRLHLSEVHERQIRVARMEIGFETPVIGLHIGGGSELAGEPDAPLEMLLDQVDAIRSTAAVNRVLVTGCENGEFSELSQDRGYDVVYGGVQLGEDTGRQSTDANLQELELLSACDWVVGRITADAPRIAAARIGARTFRCDRHRLVSSNTGGRGLGALRAKR